MAMEAVLREERAVVVEVDASFGMTETFQASDKDDSSDGHIFGEDEPMV
jgi:peptide methionine sulfoxide reductase MsrB